MVLKGDIEGILQEGEVTSGGDYVKYLLSIIKANKLVLFGNKECILLKWTGNEFLKMTLLGLFH